MELATLAMYWTALVRAAIALEIAAWHGFHHAIRARASWMGPAYALGLVRCAAWVAVALCTRAVWRRIV